MLINDRHGQLCFNETQTAFMLGISVKKLRKDRLNSKGLKYVKHGALVRYYINDITDFIETHKVEPIY